MTVVNPEPPLDGALPEWAIDILVHGLRHQEADDPRNIWTEFLRIAMCAYRRGWTQDQFVVEMTKCEKRSLHGRRRWIKHQLWVQFLAHNSQAAGIRALRKAWDSGAAYLRDVGPRSLDDLRDDAVERAFLWVDRLTDDCDGLNENEKKVMSYVISETERRGMLRVTCPARAVGEHAKLPTMTASRTLKSLNDRGLLVRHSRGRSGKEGNRRAAIYALADPRS